MKDLLKNTMTKDEYAVLLQFIHGKSEKEVVKTLDKTARTVRDARYKLLKIFNATSINELCLKAAQTGYANDFLSKLEQIRAKTVIEKLGMREILILQFIFEGLPHESIEKILPELPEREKHIMGINEILASIQRKLQLKNLDNVFFKTVVAGYMVPVPIQLNELSDDLLSQEVGEWLTGRKVLNVPLYEFKRGFMCKSLSVDNIELKQDMEELPNDKERNREK